MDSRQVSLHQPAWFYWLPPGLVCFLCHRTDHPPQCVPVRPDQPTKTEVFVRLCNVTFLSLFCFVTRALGRGDLHSVQEAFECRRELLKEIEQEKKNDESRMEAYQRWVQDYQGKVIQAKALEEAHRKEIAQRRQGNLGQRISQGFADAASGFVGLFSGGSASRAAAGGSTRVLRMPEKELPPEDASPTMKAPSLGSTECCSELPLRAHLVVRLEHVHGMTVPARCKLHWFPLSADNCSFRDALAGCDLIQLQGLKNQLDQADIQVS